MEIWGKGTINQLGLFIKDWKCSKVLIVTGKQSYDNSPKKIEIERILDKFTVIRYHNFEVNPNIESIIEGLILVADFNPDVIIGIGGGSVMDTTKLLSVLPSNKELVHEIIINAGSVPTRLSRLVLVPTTAGSGSEATHFAVVYKEKTKYSVASKNMLADLVILDPEFLETLPRELRAISAFDAFSQAVESYWSVGATKESQQYASKSLQILVETFDSLIENPTNRVWDSMMEASFLSGKAINISKTTGPHAISYAITQYFGIPHGLAVILTLPAFLSFNSTISLENLNNKLNFKEFTGRINKLFELLRVKDAESAKIKINKMIILAGFNIGLRNYGINNQADLLMLSESVNIERLSNNPINLDKYQIQAVLRKAW